MLKNTVIRLSLILLSLLLAATSIALADVSVSVDVSPTSGTVEDEFQLNVTYSGAGANTISRPEFEPSDTFEIQSSGTTTSMQIVNGSISQQLNHTFTLTPAPSLAAGNYEVPQGYLTHNDRKILLKRPIIQIVAKGAAKKEYSEGVDFVQVVSNTEPYVGEQVLYQAQIVTNSRITDASLTDPEFPGFWHESFGQQALLERRVQSTGAKVFAYRDALYALKAGPVTIPSRTFTGQVVTARRMTTNEMRDPFNSFIPEDLFGFGRYRRKRLVAPEITLNVKPLPPAPVDSNLTYVPVGKVKLRQSANTADVKQGESITVSFELTGNANLRPLELPLEKIIDKNIFKLYPDKPVLQTYERDNSIEQKKTFTYALVPMQSGNLKIASITFYVFDPQKESYEKFSTNEITLNVAADPNYAGSNYSPPPPKVTTNDNQQIPAEPKVTDGLRSQHSAADAEQASLQIPPALFWLFILLPPIIVIPVGYKKWKSRKLSQQQSTITKQKMLEDSRSKLLHLDQQAQNADQIWKLLQNYLIAKFSLERSSLTTVEALKLLSEKNVSEEIILNAKSAFIKLDSARYSGSNALDSNATTSIKDIVTALENKYLE